ncbi:MAG TPA: hypothetical protein VIL18_05815 [Longimicrobiales bacterium]
MKGYARLGAIAFAALTLGCADEPLIPQRGELAPFQTDRLAYEAAVSDGMVRLEVTVTFTNRSGEARYIARCTQESLAFSLEKYVPGGWVHAYSPGCPRIFLEPIRVPPGASHTETVRIVGLHSGDSGPDFETPVSRVYRLVSWVYRSWSMQDGGELLPEEARMSNLFEIRGPE